MYRKDTDGLDIVTRGLWSYILENVCWKPTTICVRGRPLCLEPGQMFLNAVQLAAATGIGDREIRTSVTTLAQRNLVAKHTVSRGLILTVINYSENYESQPVDKKAQRNLDGKHNESTTKPHRKADDTEPMGPNASNSPLESKNLRILESKNSRTEEEYKTKYVPRGTLQNEGKEVIPTSASQSRPPEEDIASPESPISKPIDSEMENKPAKRRKRATPSKDTPSEEESNAKALARSTWESYYGAFKQRYGTDPIRDAKANSNITQLVKRLGQESPQVIAFYVAQHTPFYVQKCHPLSLAVADAQALRTMWATNKTMASRKQTEAQEIDAKNRETIANYLKRKRAEEAQNAS